MKHPNHKSNDMGAKKEKAAPPSRPLIAGEECLVVLPGNPMEAATIFPPPLSCLALYASDLWDEQKRWGPARPPRPAPPACGVTWRCAA